MPGNGHPDGVEGPASEVALIGDANGRGLGGRTARFSVHAEPISLRTVPRVDGDLVVRRVPATLLRDAFDHDAVHVGEVGLSGADDPTVATFARGEHRAVVTENIADFAPEPDLVLICVLQRDLPSGGAQAQALADLLDRWATENPDPYVGEHWPS